MFISPSPINYTGYGRSSAPIVSYGVDPLGKWKVALQKVLTGEADAKVAMAGDSNMLGLYGGKDAFSGQPNATNGFDRSTPAAFARALFNRGVPVAYDNLWANGNIGTPAGFLNAFNARAPGAGTGWAQSSGFPSGTVPGGFQFSRASGTGVFPITSRGLVTACDLWTPLPTTAGVMSARLDAEAAVNISPGGSNAMGVTTITSMSSAPAIHTLNLDRVSGGSVYFGGCEFYDATKKQVRVQNMGWSGARSMNYACDSDSAGSSTTLPWRPRLALKQYAADLVICNLGAASAKYGDDQDWGVVGGGAIGSVQAFYNNMDRIIKDQVGSVILEKFVPNDPTDVPDATQRLFRDAVDALALSNSCVVVDVPALFGSFARANAVGKMANANHCLSTGYGDIGNIIALAALNA